jgi:hypothetical protein
MNYMVNLTLWRVSHGKGYNCLTAPRCLRITCTFCWFAKATGSYIPRLRSAAEHDSYQG